MWDAGSLDRTHQFEHDHLVMKTRLRLWKWTRKCSKVFCLFLHLIFNKIRKFRFLLFVGLLLVIALVWTFCWLGLSDFLFQDAFVTFNYTNVDVQVAVANELQGHSPLLKSYVNDMENLRLHSGHLRCDNDNNTLMIVIKSAPDRELRREAYRVAFSKINLIRRPWTVELFFVSGHYDNNIDELVRENDKHKDMIIGDFYDNYYNNTYKLMYTMKSAIEYCGSNVPFVISMDDDYVINLDNIVDYIQNATQTNDRLYSGWRMYGTPFRFRYNKFYISLSEYPYDIFPPFISGGLVFMSPQTVKEFYISMKYCKKLKFDDVYLGVLAHLLDIHPLHVPSAMVRRNMRAKRLDFTQKLGEHGYTASEIEKYIPLVNA
ncbi:unnamed protein product [Bursaphelenchus okinawaensis]|uniref:Hexosyltransferase n=1 Tax=Bursaphelenchus okinawaensis TaxID=465554 RepID=A0A811LS68_9BILA|nr:unnamed protein product [Bursaphelenchus okinawaensis]CAG9127165.1 unnamed protein product [Bursaphelenchus okinawaensis]